jgi:hypothetical protein
MQGPVEDELPSMRATLAELSSVLSQQPLVILGMHRSGTSLLTRLLVDLGVHMGQRLSRDAESVFFQRLNRKIFQAADVKWGNVEPLLEALCSRTFVNERSEDMLDSLLRDRHFPSRDVGVVRFFGSKAWAKFLRGDGVQWGWKDPRTTITFQVWHQVFPHAKFIHLTRNGVDVAISLHRRSLHQVKKLRNKIIPMDYSEETLSFEYCFQLWETYVLHVFKQKHLFSKDQYLELKYEDLLINPFKELVRVLDFVGFDVDCERIRSASQQINKERLDNSRYAKPYQSQIEPMVSSPVMKRLGYEYSLEFDQQVGS